MAASMLNKNNELARKFHALLFNITAAKSLQSIVESNLGPKGTLKMLVSGGGDFKITKDGQVLLKEMPIQHPTAMLIARATTAQDDITGDGTTSIVLFVGELLKQSESLLAEGLHPRVISDGFHLAKSHLLEWIKTFQIKKDVNDKELLASVARTALRTKLHTELADKLTDIVVDAVLTIKEEGKPIDLHMIETHMHMLHKSDMDTTLIKGLVFDHGARNPNMPKKLKNVHVLTCNVSLEYEKTEENGNIMWSSVEERERMVENERKFVDDKVRKIIDLKRQVCKEGEGFVVFNQKGIDPISLEMLAKERILALRRVKRRNMERIPRACGGVAVNSVDDLTPDVLGFAGSVHEQQLGEEKYVILDEVKRPFSCTILFKGPNMYTINQVKDAVRDGLRAVKNTIEDGYVLPGGGAFELAAHTELKKFCETHKFETIGHRLGVEAFTKALLVIPRTLIVNSGFDSIESLLKLQDEHRKGHIVGVDVNTGEPMDPTVEGIWDNLRVKRQLIESASLIAAQLLLVDEILKAGKASAQ